VGWQDYAGWREAAGALKTPRWDALKRAPTLCGGYADVADTAFDGRAGWSAAVQSYRQPARSSEVVSGRSKSPAMALGSWERT
jgi:hypothetical protein